MATASTPKDFIDISRKHLVKVQAAWSTPTDWDDLTTYGLYCLEALVQAAGLSVGIPATRYHGDKVLNAKRLHDDHGLADVSDLMRELNEGRKANAYGDIEFEESDYDAEDIAQQIENYFDEVSSFV